MEIFHPQHVGQISIYTCTIMLLSFVLYAIYIHFLLAIVVNNDCYFKVEQSKKL